MPRRQLYQGAGRIIAVSLAAGLAAWGSAQALAATNAWVQVGVGLVAGVAISAAALAIPIYRRDAKTLASFVRLMLKRDSRDA